MIPSRSYHHEASGLPMISLMLSSSSSGSIGRRNGRINSKLISVDLRAMEAQWLAGLPSEKQGLRGRFFLWHFVVLLIFLRLFWDGPFSASELQNRTDSNFPDALLRVGLLADVLPAAQFAFYLDMRALGERLREL